MARSGPRDLEKTKAPGETIIVPLFLVCLFVLSVCDARSSPRRPSDVREAILTAQAQPMPNWLNNSTTLWRCRADCSHRTSVPLCDLARLATVQYTDVFLRHRQLAVAGAMFHKCSRLQHSSQCAEQTVVDSVSNR